MSSTTKQPKALYMLFFAEMWERFSFYGMRALLILYMTQELLYNDDMSVGIYAAYGALVYATPFIGGLIADNYLGYRKSVLFGGLLMTLGHFIMAFESEATFFGALALLIVGNGFFKPNISSMVGGLYGDGDARRDGGFTIFYMGINLGAFLAPLICGIVGEGFGWHYGFGLAGVGMLIGLIVFWRGQEALGAENGIVPDAEKLSKKVGGILSTEYVIYTLTMLLVPVFAFIVMSHHVAEILNYIIGGGAILGLLILSFTMFSGKERQRLWVILVLILFSTIFWAFFEQAGSSINLYTARNVNTGILPASVFQSVNPFFIIVMAPVFAALWIRLQRANREPSTPLKFALGLFQLGLGFFILVFGASQAGSDGQSSVLYLFLGYFFHTTGELCLSPVGLSMVTKLSPKKIVAMTMGVWFISSSMAHIVGGVVAKQTSTSEYMVPTASYTPEIGQTEPVEFVINVYDKEKDSLVSEDILVKVNFDGKETEDQKMFKEIASKLDQMVIYRSVKPGETDTLNSRIPYLDPTGDLTKLKGGKESPYITTKGDDIYFKTEEEGEYEYSYTSCRTDKDDCTDILVKYTVTTKENHAPQVAKSEIHLSMPVRGYFSKFLGEESIGLPILSIVKDIDGDVCGINVIKKPAKGKVNKGNTLHPFATADRMIHKYSNVFQLIAWICMGATVVLLLLVPVLRKWMGGIH